MTTRNVLRTAVLAVINKIQSGQIASTADEIIAAAGGLESYIERCYLTARATDAAQLSKALRESTQRDGGNQQLSFDGMEHASLPAAVLVRDPDTKEDRVIPWKLAPFKDIKAQTLRNRRDLNARDAVVSAHEKTITFLEERGVTDEWTGAEIEANFSTDRSE